jgi:EmrB/QacA subfamily drug resistance transporter
VIVASQTVRRVVNPWIAMLILCAGFFMTVLDTTIVNIAIPNIIGTLHAGIDQALWVVSAYVLAIAVLIVTAGRLGDIIGARTVFVIGTVLFTGASLFCGLATTPGMLIAARAVQGVGAALMTPQPMTLMMALFPPEKRGVAGIVWGVSAGVAAVVGPTVGGLLVSWKGWPWIFFLNVPVGVITLILTLWYVPDLRSGRRTRLDFGGVVLASLGFLGITFGLLEGDRYGWGRVFGFVTIPELIIAGVLLLAVFVLLQARARANALVPLSLFKIRNFSLASAAGLAVSLGLTGVWVTLSIYLQSVLGLSPLMAGLAMAPGALVMFPIFGIAGDIIDRTGGKWFLVTGLLIFGAAGGYVLTLSHATANVWLMLPGIVLAGIGQGLVFAPLVSIATFNIRREEMGAASGAFNAIRQVGFVLAAAVVGALLQHRFDSALKTGLSTKAAYTVAMVPTLAVVIGVFLVVGLACLGITPRKQLPGNQWGGGSAEGGWEAKETEADAVPVD